MPASNRRSTARLAVLVLLVMLAGGCADEGTTSTGASQATTTAPTTTVAATTTTVPPMTAEELAWLKAVTTLHKKIDKVIQQSATLTRAKMTSYASTLRSCSRELARIGSPGDRLQSVHVIVKKACRTFDKGAKCWATAASVSMADGGVIVGTPEARTQERAIQCGGAAAGNGSNLLSDAESKGEEIKAKFD